MDECLFCAIIRGEIPSHTIYEDEHTLAFLDIRPLTEGHTLVIPKLHVQSLWELEEELYSRVMLASRKVAHRVDHVLSPKRVGALLEGFDVPHAHFHIVPLGKGLRATYADKNHEPDQKTLTDIASKLRMD